MAAVCITQVILLFPVVKFRKNNCVAAYSESGTGNGAGGGVLIANGGSMTMSETGKISDNTAPYGGGIAVGASYVDFINGTQTFTMEGGRIEGNTASVSGGGLYIQMNGVADITKGELIENHCNVDITTSRGSFGGGVYVNGGKSAGYTNGLLLLKNAEISGNTADISGGGIAACPTSNVNIYLTDGGVFYGNEAKGNVETWTEGRVPEIGKDIFVTSVYPSLTEIDKLYISGYMLGGGAYHWREDSGEEVALNDVGNVDLDGALDGVNDNIALHTEKGRGDADIEKAHDMATVFIIGNTSTKRGGGIGTNGDVEIGTKDDVIQIRVTKKWSGDEDNVSLRPDRIKVWLLRSEDGTAFERVGYGWLEKAADGTWPTLVFEEQPRQFTGEANQKLDYIYKVEEETIDHYKPEYSDVEKDNGGNFAVAITNTFEMTTNLEVNKVWRAANGTDETRENLPGSITVNLYRVKGETETLVKSATLTAETDWKYRFTDLELLEEGETWKITENTVSNWNGAISEIGGDAIGGYTVTITNVYTPPTTPPPPVTPPPTPTPTPTPPPTPTPSPTPTPTPVNIPDNPTPLMSIPDEPTPLTNFENIMDEEVPLAAAPMTGDEKPVGMAALIGIAALGLMGVFGILGRRKDEEA